MAKDRPGSETQALSLLDIRGSQKSSGLYFTLTVIEGRDFGCVFQLTNAENTIGRKDEAEEAHANIRLDDDRVSRQHLLIVKRELKGLGDEGPSLVVMAIDLGSKNGTFLNNKRIQQEETLLHNGDKLQVGNTVFKFEIKDNLDTSYQERLYDQVTRDPLTGLWNHNHVRQEMDKFISLAKRNGSPFSLLIVEIDFLQILNESYGRTTGDAILRTIAQRITSEISEYEIAGRFAGKQFLILVPDTDMKRAASLAERIRQSVESFDSSTLGCDQRITVSVGVSQFPICGNNAEALIKQADEALFRAKQLGNNRVYEADALIETSIKSKGRWFFAVGLILLAAIAVTAGVMFYKKQQTPAQPTAALFYGMIEAREVQVGSKIGGRIKEVLVEEGTLIEAGQPLARFDVSDLLAERKLLESRLAQFEANLTKLQNGYRPEEIAESDAAVGQAKAILEEKRNGPRSREIIQAKVDLNAGLTDLANAETTFNRIERVYSRGYESKQVRDDAENSVKLAKARVDVLRERLLLLEEGTRVEEIRAAEEKYQAMQARAKMLRSGSRSEDIAAARAEVAASKAAIEQLMVKISEGEVLSPAKSLVEVIKIRPGDILPPGKPIAVLLEQDQLWVKIYVPQTELGLVKIGQKATIRVDSLPTVKFSGYIEQISSQAEFYPRNIQTKSDRDHQVFAVKVHIDNKDGTLKSGMNAEVSLEPGTVK